MGYEEHFRLADDYISHLDPSISNIVDPFILSRYTGFLSVSAVTVYELAIKKIFIDFASNKHNVFGVFAYSHFDRINGRIKLGELRKSHISSFGDKYLIRFDRLLNEVENSVFRSEGVSVKNSYNNIIQWRHDFAHEGRSPSTATYNEVKQSYYTGKYLIECLYHTMKR